MRNPQFYVSGMRPMHFLASVKVVDSVFESYSMIHTLRHPCRPTHICLSELYHYLNQCWIIVNWTSSTNFSWMRIKIPQFSYKKISSKMSYIYLPTWGHLSRPQCVETAPYDVLVVSVSVVISFWRLFLTVQLQPSDRPSRPLTLETAKSAWSPVIIYSTEHTT